MIDSDDLVTAVEPTRVIEYQRALQIRIKQRYNCPEIPILTLRAPFVGFSAYVRFQSRARIHTVEILDKRDIDRLLNATPV
ncbi:unnamed protein product [Caenorhabditis angaria]|uniref:Uncharacterized protein n=1 Tax=Caenorhabditis angaria TaxID=860376 RepID=A0A9P1IN90_9PELO|nr:unnamed protein product [Caenorhabditis angaria]